jgi:hypothetical protein
MLAHQTVALAEKGDIGSAVSVASEAAGECAQRGYRARAAVHSLQHAYLLASAAANGREAAALATKAVEFDQSPEFIGHAATILARNGVTRLDWLTNLLPALDVPRYRAARHRAIGEVAAATGHFSDALMAFESSAKNDPRPYGNELLLYGYQLVGDHKRAERERLSLERIRLFYSRNLCPLSPAMANINYSN